MRTTKAQFREFVSECRKWIRVFGLSDWYVRFSHSDDYPSSFANCSADTGSRECTITLAINIGDYEPYELGEVALEEVLHIVASDIRFFIPPKDRDECMRFEHAAIARIINAIYPHRKVICG